MRYLYFHANFGKAWLTEDRIALIARTLARPWGPELYGSVEPTRRLTPDGLAASLASVGTGSVALDTPRGAGKRVVGEVSNGGRPLGDGSIHATGSIDLWMELPSEHPLAEIHAF